MCNSKNHPESIYYLDPTYLTSLAKALLLVRAARWEGVARVWRAARRDARARLSMVC